MSFLQYSKYKRSGVQWIGNVPTSWDVCALNYRYEIALGKMLDEKKITGCHLAPYLRNVDVQWGRINSESLPEMDFDDQDRRRYSLQSGDLLVCEGGEVRKVRGVGRPADGVLLPEGPSSHPRKRPQL